MQQFKFHLINKNNLQHNILFIFTITLYFILAIYIRLLKVSSLTYIFIIEIGKLFQILGPCLNDAQYTFKGK